MPERLPVARLHEALAPPVVTWSSAAVRSRVAGELDLEPVQTGQLPARTGTLVACGGGALIDLAKAATRTGAERVRLVAVPTLWGAGAEASPVIVLSRAGGKEIMLDAAFVPDVRIVWPEAAADAPEALRRAGSADVWAHTLEALVSPLADDRCRADAAEIVEQLLELTPDGEHALAWLDLSAEACNMQARASVGLAHGIAHQLEQHVPIGHARLIAAVLPTVFALDVTESRRWPEVAERYSLDADMISASIGALADPSDVARIRAVLPKHWRSILRDPMTRTNGFLVRPAHLDSLMGVAA
jgi:alcohol dehydrogenase class IV